MNPQDFGTPGPRRRSRTRSKESDPALTVVQWANPADATFTASGHTLHQLPPGAYVGHDTYTQGIQVKAKALHEDDWLDLPDDTATAVFQEIERFHASRDSYRQLGLLHRRGYLFYGPQGAGKSSQVKRIVRNAIAAGQAAFFCEDPGVFLKTMELFRQIEPERPVLCVFEDIDAIIDEHGDTELLQWLDGYQQINHAVNLATTNYPEKLDRRIICRPRRFDRVIKVETISAATREAYLAQKLPDLKAKELRSWVNRTKGLSFAALAELVVSVACLGQDCDQTLQRLRAMEGQRASSKEFDRPGGMGFILTTDAVNEES